jgi:hypothetical protein
MSLLGSPNVAIVISFVNRPVDLCLKIVPNGRWKTSGRKADGRSAAARFGNKNNKCVTGRNE